MDNTKDPVSVLRKVIHELRTYSPPADNYKGVHIHPCWAKEIEGALAAIQHSEQRETVPAGDVLYAIIYDEHDKRPVIVIGEQAARATLARIGAQGFNAHLFAKLKSNSRDDPNYSRNLAAPVAAPVPETADACLDDVHLCAVDKKGNGVCLFCEKEVSFPPDEPVPEAKAEQVGGYSKSARDSMQLMIISALLDDPDHQYDSGGEADYTTPLTDKVHALVVASRAAPAVKHEASELPPLIVKVERNRVWIARGSQSFMLAYEADADQELNWYADQLRTVITGFTPDVKNASSQSAPPIAVQGSIADDAEEVIDLYAGLLEQKMLADRARGFEQSPSYYIKDAIRYTLTAFESRSPVAAAPERNDLGEMQASHRAAGAGSIGNDAVVRNAALEEAAKVCDDRHHTWRWDNEDDSDSGPRDCARSIRALSAAAPSADAKGEA